MALGLLGCGSSGPVAPPPVAEAAELPRRAKVLGRARVAAVGDTMMHGMVQDTARRAEVRVDGASANHGGYDALWADVAPRLAAADVAFTNLESPVSPSGAPVKPMVFNAPASVPGALRAAGFDVVSAANNHAWDQGRPGLVETLDALDAAGLARIGAGRTCAEARAFRLVEADGVRLAFVGACTLYNVDLNRGADEPCVYTLDEPGAIAEAAAARAAGADLVVLSVHWGVEYAKEPQPEEQRAVARRLVEAGYDVILGHHPHVLQPIEVLDTADGRTALVAYSLGNFVSSQSAWYRPGVHALDAGDPRDGVVLEWTAVKRRYPGDVVRTTVEDVTVTPLWTVHELRGGATGVRVVPLEGLLAERERALAAASEGEVVALTREVEHLRARRRAVARRLGPGWLPVEGAPEGEDG